MVIRTGIIGFSEGNGHPFSFSAIVNGYDRKAFSEAGWPVILDYLSRQPADRFGVGDARICCAWTQDHSLTQKLCAACNIERAVKAPEEMLGQIDALIIARDDWQTHAKFAMPFLEAGIPVFIDKPLSLDISELEAFQPYLKAGLLMSTSGLRYAIELEEYTQNKDKIGDIRFVSATVVNDLDKYGIHILDALSGLGFSKPRFISRADTGYESYDIRYDNDVALRLDCLGKVAKTFRINIYGENGNLHLELANNFMAFRRTLERFFNMVVDRKPPIAPDSVIGTMNLIRLAKSMPPSQMLEVSNA
ncbi:MULTISPECIES: Gfo/Idh/MocA family oxidoreductase [Thalassospira]|uniref:Gfo/Idh/MocA-like oxidoreductase N-terminal domain-containing protein n=2 Tax=Thalassospira tepidiphila TaxID=393657 RepID=A0A853L5Q1_9PROT|nr:MULTISPECIES: Gfo/Idh/MocA family oxidoreductase [Thalassospira]MBO6577945.1 Gfo/Idh/MocA family oxidoreductase [Thalassospira sp.]MBO6817247.1 Gfo/Idh/MocA family oxidoreductase [Thalassospira sp.]NJB73908.1 hypothetical protein [Thalassospira tepidiphila]OAZ11929.1 hypothetical protein TH4_02295 [Thalassospira tepidiphila MCCC 1A03514]QPO11203.1 Gfo/Idh/MocA family oxidoreductase [Thalassospira sp. A40-3]|tara:strand:- start:401 stop:1315 length:915 start_codon:yes stop_codon:yes gene_type:complete